MDVLGPLVLAAAAAIGGVSGFNRLKRARLRTDEDARNGWLAHFPGDRVTESVVSRDGRAALVDTSWGTGVLCRGGAMARRLDGAEVAQVSDGLEIRFNSVDLPRIRVLLPDAVADRWADRIAES